MPQGKTEAFRSRLGNWIMDSPCDNRRPVGQLDADTVIRDPVPEVQFRDEEAEMRIVLHVQHTCRNDSVMHSDTLTLRLMTLF